ncbi:hypothetical protein BC830DRAFT_1164079 [Chytriomyces sp. MP71]|nr:hypothetical protein BC830DRAFT_1164079 [Chytriomyces sp. MP71]
MLGVDVAAIPPKSLRSATSGVSLRSFKVKRAKTRPPSALSFSSPVLEYDLDEHKKQSRFAVLTRATDFSTVGRIHFTLGILDSIVLYRTLGATSCVMVAIQLIWSFASAKPNPFSSAQAFAAYVTDNAAIGYTLVVILVAYLYFRASHWAALHLDRDEELRGYAGTCRTDEVAAGHTWFRKWGDGEPDFSDMAVQVRAAERAIALSIARKVNLKNELFTAYELSVGGVSDQEASSNEDGELPSLTGNAIKSPSIVSPMYSYPKSARLHHMNVLRMPMATSTSLNLRLKAPTPHPNGNISTPIVDTPIGQELEEIGFVDTTLAEAVWCVPDAGGVCVTVREPDLSTDEMMGVRNVVLTHRKEALERQKLPTALGQRRRYCLDEKVVGVSSNGVEVVMEEELDQEQKRVLGWV